MKTGPLKIKNKTQYGNTLLLIDRLMTAIEDYDKKHVKIDPPSPIDAIRFRMEQQRLKPKHLIPYIGSRNRVSEVLNGKRGLSKRMIINLHKGLGISTETLLGIK